MTQSNAIATKAKTAGSNARPQDDPPLKETFDDEHLKHRLLGHWGASRALSFVWAHLSRLIKRDDLDPGHIGSHGTPENPGLGPRQW